MARWHDRPLTIAGTRLADIDRAGYSGDPDRSEASDPRRVAVARDAPLGSRHTSPCGTCSAVRQPCATILAVRTATLLIGGFMVICMFWRFRFAHTERARTAATVVGAVVALALIGVSVGDLVARRVR